jgi:hypothetical protein
MVHTAMPPGALTARLSGVPWKLARQIAVTETYTVTHSHLNEVARAMVKKWA